MQQFIFNYYVNEFNTYLFILQGVLYVVLRRQVENAVTLPPNAQQKHAFWGEIKSKLEKLAPGKKFALELLHHILGHRSTRSMMAGDTKMFWKDIILG